MIDSFDMNGHICLVFPILGESTYDFQKANDFLPYQFNDIKNMAYQMLKAIECMYFTIDFAGSSLKWMVLGQSRRSMGIQPNGSND